MSIPLKLSLAGWSGAQFTSQTNFGSVRERGGEGEEKEREGERGRLGGGEKERDGKYEREGVYNFLFFP